MGLIQKRVSSNIDIGKIVQLSFVGAVLCLLLTIFSSSTPSVNAIGNCPGAEQQGTGSNIGKCLLNGNPTANAPTGQTPANNDPTAAGQDPAQSDTTEEGTTCAVEKIGWILCPIIESAAKISDKAFDILADNFLRTDPELFSDKSGTKTAWEIARNLANVMFIIAFIIIILSQVTGRGLDNYGIKKMLPRLVIAAIAVNVSYYICQLAVDVTNILGYEIQNALAEISNGLGPSVFGSASEYAGTQQSTGGGDTLLFVIAGAALATAAVIWVTLPMLASVVLFVLITVITIIIILLLRKAIIVLLIVVSPIAFVLYLLPNTEKFFSKWMSMFGKLLMVFPIVGMLFGGGQLASTIILVSGAQSQQQAQAARECNPEDDESKKSYENGTTEQKPNNYDTCGAGSVTISGTKDGDTNCGGQTSDGCSTTASWTLGLVAMGVAVAPLMAVWAVLKGALAAAGAIGGRIATNIQKGVDRGGKGIGNKVGEKYKESAFGIGAEIRQAGKKSFKRKRVLSSLGVKKPEGIDKYRQYAAGGVPGLLKKSDTLNVGSIRAQNQAIERAASARGEIDSEETKNALAAIEYHEKGKLLGAQEVFDTAIDTGDYTKAKAAIAALATSGEAGMNALADKLEKLQIEAPKLSGDVKEYILQAHGNVKEKDAAVHAWAASGPEATNTVSQYAAEASTFAKLTDAQFSTQTTLSLQSAGAQQALRLESAGVTRKDRLLNNPENARSLSDNKRNTINNA